jgi:anaerobic ribonucleoside-triphosphate reductase activating protein
MNFLKIAKSSTHSGFGIRVVIYVSGCRNHCPGCQNPETWCFSTGQPYTEEIEREILTQIKKPHIAGLTLCGGDPGELENQGPCSALAAKVRALGKSVWCYTGYELEDFLEGGKRCGPDTKAFLENIDVLITGRYREELRDITNNNLYRGSKNQRVLDLPASLTTGRPAALENIPNNEI